MRRISTVLILGALATACGGGGDGVTTPATPTATPADTHPVAVVVYDDENRNGQNDGNETTWMPEVDVEIAGRTARTEKRTGRAVVTGVPRGTHTITLRASSLPPYYAASTVATVAVPTAPDAVVKVAVSLPIRRTNPGLYFASGDSISQGENTPNFGFRNTLQARLDDHFGRARLVYRGGGGGRTADGVLRLPRDMGGILPDYTMLMWGVNDWHTEGCSNPAATTCPVIPNLRTMIRIVREYESLPCVATLTPSNPAFPDMAPPQRNEWVRQVNDLIRALARDERVLLIDVGAAFARETDLSRLFEDHVHPNEAGYEVIMNAYFQALTHGTVGGATPVLFDAPGAF